MPLLAFLVAVSYLPLGLFPSGAELGRWSLISVGAAVALWRGDLQPLGWVMGLALAWCVTGLLWSLDPISTVGQLVHLVALLVLVCAAPYDLGRTLTWMTAGVAVSSGVALWQWWVGTGTEFATGLFAGKNQAVEVAVPLAVWCLFSKRWLLALLLVPLIVISGAKEVVLMALVAGGFTILKWRPSWLNPVEAGVFEITLVSLTVLFVVGGVVLFTNAAATLGERTIMWGNAFRAWQAQPWGWGLGTFPWMFPNYEYAHNDFVQMFTETGPLAPFLGCALAVLISSTPGHRPERAALLALLASSLLWWPLHAPVSVFLAALLVGNLVYARRAELRSRVAEWGHLEDRSYFAGGALRGVAERSVLVPFGLPFAPAARTVQAGIQRSGSFTQALAELPSCGAV